MIEERERRWVCWETDAEDGVARNEGRPKSRFMDAVREDMAVIDVTKEDADDITKWRWKFYCDAPNGSSQKKNWMHQLSDREITSTASGDSIRKGYFVGHMITIDHISRLDSALLSCREFCSIASSTSLANVTG